MFYHQSLVHYFVIQESLTNINVVYSNMESLMKHESCSILEYGKVYIIMKVEEQT